MTRPTAHAATFAGRQRIFDLRIDEIGQLETLCGSGIGAIYTRVATLQFRLSDVRETIRLGLIGGGLVASHADLLVEQNVDGRPINESVPLAYSILKHLFDGLAAATEDDPSGEAERSGSPATSAPSSQPDSLQGLVPQT